MDYPHTQIDRSNIDAAGGSVDVRAHRRSDPPALATRQIIIRGDSGFCRDQIMAGCESQQRMAFLLGLPKNARLLKESLSERADVHIAYLRTHKPFRVFCQFNYQTRDSWSRSRRVVCKAECLAKEENPRFVMADHAYLESAAATASISTR